MIDHAEQVGVGEEAHLERRHQDHQRRSHTLGERFLMHQAGEDGGEENQRQGGTHGNSEQVQFGGPCHRHMSAGHRDVERRHAGNQPGGNGMLEVLFAIEQAEHYQAAKHDGQCAAQYP
ncbi:hypothetical protein D3C80_1613900 [compost metagenome]